MREWSRPIVIETIRYMGIPIFEIVSPSDAKIESWSYLVRRPEFLRAREDWDDA
jgi:hypothetical protein